MTAAERATLEAMSESEKLALAKKYRAAYWSDAWMTVDEDKRIDALNHR